MTAFQNETLRAVKDWAIIKKAHDEKQMTDEMNVEACFCYENVNVYRSISSSSGVASPVMDIGVLSIMGLGEGRGVMRVAFLRLSASFSCSHCSAILPQSTAVWEVVLLNGKGRKCPRHQ